MPDGVNSTVQVVENTFIPLADGRRLAARIWMPDPATTIRTHWPAILEYIPYRKRDATAQRDESTYPRFAAAGYVGVRVDIAGHGESDGIFDDEYSPRELADGVEVIAWIAAQDWCDGRVGMMGISWGGFNSLQIAALRPPALKAVIAIGTTVDRYNDDIHYKNGCLLSANFSWSCTMLAYAARPPDPDLVGRDWRYLWRKRLDSQPFPLETWLAHQTRDDYWKHGSVSEDYAAIDAPVLAISGWADGYINAPPALAANLGFRGKAINGPWIHKYPHFAWPKPRMDFPAEALRWWDRWLKGLRNGADDLPAYRAYLSENVRPGGRREDEPGRWVAETEWPSTAIETETWHLNGDGLLSPQPGQPVLRTISSPEDCGIACGEFFTQKPDAELPGDQRIDDGGSLVFTSGVLSEPIDILGRPRLKLRVSVDKPIANLAVRLIDYHPDGVGHRVSFGVLNLCHRNGNEKPRPMPPGRAEDVEIPLDECGYRFLPGHQIGLAVSTAYWPMILPGPERVTATLALGPHAALALPVRWFGETIDIAEPTDPDPLPAYRMHRQAVSRRWIERDLQQGTTRYHILEDSGDSEMPGHGMIAGDQRRECYSIAPDDPLKLTLDGAYSCRMRRGDWSVRVETTSRLTCTATDFLLKAKVAAFEGDTLFSERVWTKTLPRTCM
ncbi:MAG: CocE/NonD family hydrolase [Pseudomonadota bacterium]